MDTINISKKIIKKAEELKLSSVESSEGYVIRDPKDPQKAFKLLHKKSGVNFSNKLYTINSLIDLSERIDMPEMVFPECLLTVDDEVVGFSMLLIDGVTLAEILCNADIDIKVKVKYLKQIGSILEKMASVRKENPKLNWYLNDLHERNFMVDLEKERLYAVDLDSCRILGNHPFVSKYLSLFSPLIDFPEKYHTDFQISCGGDFVADENADLYCYAMLVIDFLYGARINYASKEEYFGYLEYLKSIGAPRELVDAWAKVYTNDNNVNFAPLLDSLPYFYEKADRELYLKRTKGMPRK